MYQQILLACANADECIPRVKKHNEVKCMPGCGCSHLGALWWHHKWKAEGKPPEGDTAEMRRMTRAIYHGKVKDIKRDRQKIEKQNMAEAVVERNDRKLWNEVRKIRCSKSGSRPLSVDNVSGEQEICDIFVNKYSNLYNSVPYDLDEMKSIKDRIDDRIRKYKEHYTINVDDVKKAIHNLKCGKSDGEEGLSSDHFIHAPALLNVFLSLVFNAMLYHGVSPDSMRIGTMIPIPKVKKTDYM